VPAGIPENGPKTMVNKVLIMLEKG